MNNLINDLQKYNDKLPAHFIFWKVTNKNKTEVFIRQPKIFTESTFYKTNKLYPIRFHKHISRNFNF